MGPIERIKKEGMFHDMIEAGALSHVWIADSHPEKRAVASFVKSTFLHTRSAQIAFSPEFTTCNSCQKVTRGLVDVCPYCCTPTIDGVAPVVDSAVMPSSWSKDE